MTEQSPTPLNGEQQARACAALIARDVLAKSSLGGKSAPDAWQVLAVADWIITGDTTLTDPTDADALGPKPLQPDPLDEPL